MVEALLLQLQRHDTPLEVVYGSDIGDLALAVEAAAEVSDVVVVEGPLLYEPSDVEAMRSLVETFDTVVVAVTTGGWDVGDTLHFLRERCGLRHLDGYSWVVVNRPLGIG